MSIAKGAFKYSGGYYGNRYSCSYAEISSRSFELQKSNSEYSHKVTKWKSLGKTYGVSNF